MAKEVQITRTITTTVCEVFCVDKKSKETFTTTVILPRTYKDETAMLNAAYAAIDSDDVRAVSIEKYEVKNELRGMSEADFIKYSKVLPPRPVKSTDDTTEDNTVTD